MQRSHNGEIKRNTQTCIYRLWMDVTILNKDFCLANILGDKMNLGIALSDPMEKI